MTDIDQASRAADQANADFAAAQREMLKDPYALTGWGSGPVTKDLELPSGQRCKIKMLDMESIIELGMVDALDTFSAQLLPNQKKKSGKAKTKKEQDEQAAADVLGMFADSEKFQKLKESMDRVAVYCVIAPKVYPNPEPDQEPVEGRLYAQMIPLMDKMDIFTGAMEGMSELGQFREGSEAGVGDVAEKSGSGAGSVSNGGDQESS